MVSDDGDSVCEGKTKGVFELGAGEQGAAAEVVERRRSGAVDAPGLFAHGDDAGAGGGGGGEVEVGELGEGIADGVVDGAFADLAAFDVGDGDAEGEGDGGGGEHLVAVGDEEEEVGSYLGQGVGQSQHREAEGFGHAGVGIGAEEALDAGGDGEAVAFDLMDGIAELRGEMGGEDDELEVDVGVGG